MNEDKTFSTSVKHHSCDFNKDKITKNDQSVPFPDEISVEVSLKSMNPFRRYVADKAFVKLL